MTTVVESIADLPELVGTHLGYSEWITVDQQRINLFADATGDHQWIHLDAERAKAGPFGTTIAHGYLTLSLFIPMWADLLKVTSSRMGVNYGLNKVRFPDPVPVDSRVRAGATLAAVEEVPGGVQITVDAVIEREGGAKPACVAQPVFRIYS